jgi:hypothetical protein
MKQNPGVSREDQKHIPSSTMRCTREAILGYCRDVSIQLKGKRCSGKSIRGNVDITLRLEL